MLVYATYDEWISRKDMWDILEVKRYFHAASIDEAVDMIKRDDPFNRIKDIVVRPATDLEINSYKPC